MNDSIGRKITYLRLSVTDLCNLRCRYCMPEKGVCPKSHDEILTEEEMVSAVRAAVGLGVTKVRITGGEPLVKKNILSLCERIASIDGVSDLALTTNGTLLPKMAEDLKSAGVNRVNISLDTLKPQKYTYITRRSSFEEAIDGITAALNAGFKKVKINTVLIGGFNDDEIPDFAKLTMASPIDLRFIELMPVYQSPDIGPEAYLPASKILEALPDLKEEPSDGVARLFSFEGAQGKIGIISPMTNDFCASCNRIRITADGKIKPCLHSPAEYSIKGLSEAEMKAQIIKAINEKPDRRGELNCLNPSNSGRYMNQIGG